MSLNDVPAVRKLFAKHKITAVKTTYSVRPQRGSSGRAKEVIISNR